MKYYDLDPTELEILQEFNMGNFTSTSSDEDLAQYQAYAQAQLSKTKHVNIRLSAGDLWKLKAKALTEGIPYQTLAASYIHKAIMAA